VSGGRFILPQILTLREVVYPPKTEGKLFVEVYKIAGEISIQPSTFLNDASEHGV